MTGASQRLMARRLWRRLLGASSGRVAPAIRLSADVGANDGAAAVARDVLCIWALTRRLTDCCCGLSNARCFRPVTHHSAVRGRCRQLLPLLRCQPAATIYLLALAERAELCVDAQQLRQDAVQP